MGDKGAFCGLVALIGWGTADFLAAKLSRRIGNLGAALLFNIFGILMSAAYLVVSRAPFDLGGMLTFKLGFYLFLGTFFQVIAGLSFYKGMTVGKIGLVSALASPWSVVVIFYGLIFLGESLSFTQVLAIALIILGTVLASVNFGKEIKSVSELLDPGVIYALVALIGWGVGFILLEFPISKIGWLQTELVFFVLSLVMLLVYVLGARQEFKWSCFKDLKNLAYGFFAGLFAFSAYAGYFFGVGHFSRAVVATLAAAYPVVTIFGTYLFSKERLRVGQLMGVALVITGAVLIAG